MISTTSNLSYSFEKLVLMKNLLLDTGKYSKGNIISLGWRWGCKNIAKGLPFRGEGANSSKINYVICG